MQLEIKSNDSITEQWKNFVAKQATLIMHLRLSSLDMVGELYSFS